MVAITKDEAMKIREADKKTKIVRTMSQKSKRHHYYADETMAALRILSNIRGVGIGDIVDE